MCLNVAAIVWHVTVAVSGDVAVHEKATGGCGCTLRARVGDVGKQQPTAPQAQPRAGTRHTRECSLQRPGARSRTRAQETSEC